MSIIKNHLELIAGVVSGEQKGFYTWLLKEGRLFTQKDFLETKSRELSDEVGAELKMCYRNSHHVQDVTGLDYYEGFYVFEDLGIVTEHGFNVEDGKVIDVTSILLKYGQPIEWYGVKVELDDSIEYYGDGIKNQYKKHIKS